MNTRVFIAACALVCLAMPLPSSAQSKTEEVKRVLKRFEHEPSVRATQKATMRYAQINSDTMESWATRSRLAHIIPGEVQAEVDFQTDADERLQTREELIRVDPDDFDSDLAIDELQNTQTLDDDSRVKYGISADWELNRLIFNDDELDVASEVTRLVKLREQLLNTVTKLYYERRRLQVEQVLNPPTDTAEAVRMQLRIDELTADIDALTGGWFSQQLDR